MGSVATPTIVVSNALRVGAGEANANVGDGTLYFVQGVIDVNGGGMYLAGQDAASNESNTTGTVVMGTSGGSLTGAQLFTRGSNLEVGRGGTGVFTQYSGTVTVETSNLILGQAATGDGTYTIYDGKLETLAGQIRVGNTGLGLFNQEGGEVISKGTLDLGNSNDPASDGTYNLRGGSLTVNGSLLVGNLAKGVFNFEGGTFTLGNTIHVASANTNADGTLNLGTASGPTVALETTQFEVGRQGTGVVNHVNADVDVNVNGANNLVISQYSDGYATYNMIGGTLDVLSGSQGNLNFNAGNGVFNQTGGTVTLHGGDVNMTNNATGDATYNLKGGLLDLGGGNVDPGPGTETFNFTGGTLKNVGTFGFTLTQDDTDGLSVLAPGASPGTMNVSGDYNMLGGVYEVEISDSANDYVIVSGDATLDGQLQVLLLGGYDPPFGSTYNVLTAQNVTLETNFGIDSSLTAGYGFYYTLISGGNGQILQLTAVPEPSTLVGLAGMALAGLLFLRRRKKA